MPKPTITLPPSGTLCSNDSIQLTFTGTEGFAITGTGLPTIITPTDSIGHYTVIQKCDSLYRTYTVKIPVAVSGVPATGGTWNISIAKLVDAFCDTNLNIVLSYTIKPVPAFTLSSAILCSGDTVPIAITGAKDSTITYNIVGKNDCDRCGNEDKWVAMNLSPTLTTSLSTSSPTIGQYNGKITGTANGNWIFHVNSITVGGCTITNPAQQNITDCQSSPPPLP
jgi:hypothetical protein